MSEEAPKFETGEEALAYMLQYLIVDERLTAAFTSAVIAALDVTGFDIVKRCASA